jgi:hypothetical protein
MAKTFLALASLADLPSFAPAKDSKVIGVRDGDYIGFTNVAQIFRFPRDTGISRTVSGKTPPPPAAPIQQPCAAIHSSE